MPISVNEHGTITRRDTDKHQRFWTGDDDTDLPTGTTVLVLNGSTSVGDGEPHDPHIPLTSVSDLVALLRRDDLPTVGTLNDIYGAPDDFPRTPYFIVARFDMNDTLSDRPCVHCNEDIDDEDTYLIIQSRLVKHDEYDVYDGGWCAALCHDTCRDGLVQTFQQEPRSSS